MTGLFSSERSPEHDALWAALRAGASGEEASLGTASSFGDSFYDLYVPIAAPPRTPFVIAQLGQSLDGYIATKSGASHYVTGPESLIHLHRLRALCDAVVVGWRTVAADDPQLTVRHVTGDNPMRVVIDLAGRLPRNHRLFSSTTAGALRITGPGIAPLRDVESAEVSLDQGRANPHAIVSLLAARGCKRILIEGGGALVSGFLAAGTLDRIHLAVAPLLIGEGRRGISLPSSDSLEHALRPKCRRYDMGDDVLFDLDLASRAR